MKNFLYNIIKPIDGLNSVKHLQTCIYNSISLFFALLMNIISIQILTFDQSYSPDEQTYLALHNTVVSLGFFLSYALGKTKNYNSAMLLFQVLFFSGCFLTLLNVPTNTMFLEVAPYLAIQLLLASVFYDTKKLFIHFSMIILALITVTAYADSVSLKELMQSSILTLTVLAVGIVNIKIRERVIEEVRNEKSKIEKSTRIETLVEINKGLSHDLNNPLTIITSANEIAKLELIGDDTDKKRVIELIEKSDKTVTRISDTIKTFNRMSEPEIDS